MRLIMPRLYLGILLILSNSDKGKPVKYHVNGHLSQINGLILLRYFVAGTFSVDIVLSSDGNIDRQMRHKKKQIFSESEPESKPEPEKEPKPVFACKCGIELPKDKKIIGGTDVPHVGFS